MTRLVIAILLAVVFMTSTASNSAMAAVKRPLDVTSDNIIVHENSSFYLKDWKDYTAFYHFTFSCIDIGAVDVPLPAIPLDAYSSIFVPEIARTTLFGQSPGGGPPDRSRIEVHGLDGVPYNCTASDVTTKTRWTITFHVRYWAQ